MAITNFDFDFMRFRKLAAIASISLVAGALLSLAFNQVETEVIEYD